MLKNTLMILLTLSVIPLIGKDSPEISKIRTYYNEIEKRIADDSLQKMEFHLVYQVIPAIGAPESRVYVYYDMVNVRESDYVTYILKVQNYYQHAGRAFYEEFLYDKKGSIIFYFGRIGNGGIGNPADIEWDYDERYYFSNKNLIRVMVGNSVKQKLTQKETDRGRKILARAEAMRSRYCAMRFPEPLTFLMD